MNPPIDGVTGRFVVELELEFDTTGFGFRVESIATGGIGLF